ncbi:MAG: hypothetical protein BWY70_01792 [Bacteroidetes bacterium ADurb.Bin408]|nr:MAG: hypothetical protein BWY70_01792 [Bacteroidetes bacterium ADurb.Bin408]
MNLNPEQLPTYKALFPVLRTQTTSDILSDLIEISVFGVSIPDANTQKENLQNKFERGLRFIFSIMKSKFLTSLSRKNLKQREKWRLLFRPFTEKKSEGKIQ